MTTSVGIGGASWLSRLAMLAVMGIVLGSPGPARAGSTTPSALEVCVHRDRTGQFFGLIRIVRAHDRCGWREVRLTLSLAALPEPAGAGDGNPAGYGAITGTVLSCLAAGGAAGSFAYVAGRSHVAITDDSGEFTLSHLPPGTYDLTLKVPGITESALVSGVEVSAGETTPVGTTTVCFAGE